MVSPIEIEEVGAALASIKHRSAPGVDGRTITDIRRMDAEKVAWVANACLWMGALPGGWMKGRTVLLPKSDSPTDPGDFQPITITPLITMILQKILTKRLNTLAPLPMQQRGFKWGRDALPTSSCYGHW